MWRAGRFAGVCMDIPEQAGAITKEGDVFVVAYAQPTDGEPPGWRAVQTS